MSPHTRAGERKRSGSGSGSGTAPAKLRRAHRKSRNGCLECKRRHIKCDEARPACSNCVVSERTCSFPSTSTPSTTQTQTQTSATTSNPAPTVATLPSHTIPSSYVAPSIISNGQVQSPAGSSHSPAAITPQPYFISSSSSLPYAHLVDDSVSFPTTLPSFNESFAVTTTSTGSPTSTSPSDNPQPLFTAQHFVLLHHALTKMSLTDGHMKPVTDLVIEWTQEAPYAVHQLLALAADHYNKHSKGRDESYRRIATELQTRALMGFNRSNQELANASEAEQSRYRVPRFLFATLLSIHMLYETFAYYRASFHIFIDRFLESVSLHRGVRTLVTSVLDNLLYTDLWPFFLNIREAEAGKNHDGTECTTLIELIESSDLAPSSIVACKSAAQTLQWAFNVHANLPPADNTHAATAFPVLLTADFVDNVRKHRPEGLIVLAYYGVLLHRCRKSWIFGDAGSFLVRLIADYLGAYWVEPMRWPLEQLEKDDEKDDATEVG